ncbi:hypothetical protein ALC56_08412 [Trachymyrmex septentrionalis]|uniref:Double jelly roll-like domain-containing protein n=1 Tax=Trachymyrmex septentrionalis TaxID=34720 RepID=A0A151JV61_9HYME|nr:hypothetical protein ALC56_08412 [Trachymyrmex septentrionalis]
MSLTLTLSRKSTVLAANYFPAIDLSRFDMNSNGVEINRNRNVGITSTIKNYVTVSSDRSVILRNAGWDAQTTAAGYFNFCVPLYVLLGFCENYRRVVINARHELILIRARNDNNCLTGDSATEPTLELFKVQWRMLHVFVIERDKLAEHNQAFVIKMTSQLEKPRYVIFAMQTGRKNMSEDASRFDHCKLTFLTRSDRSCASWLSAYHHGLRWEDGMVPYYGNQCLGRTAVLEWHKRFLEGRETLEDDKKSGRPIFKFNHCSLLDIWQEHNLEILAILYQHLVSFFMRKCRVLSRISIICGSF